jgi:membrane protease YdiL (CAAX protease family)
VRGHLEPREGAHSSRLSPSGRLQGVSEPEVDVQRPRERPGLELLAVLFTSYLFSGLSALLDLVRSEITVQGGIGNTQTGPIVYVPPPTTYPWLDFAENALKLAGSYATPLLALVLLARYPGGPGLGIGFDVRRFGRTVVQGTAFAAVIGLPGLGLVYLAHRWGFNASLNVVDFPDVWYRIPYLLGDAFQNGLGEEVVVVAFMLTRLRQCGWTDQRALIASATLRGSYHLYQGYGGFAGNFVMGLVFGYWFQRTRRVLPLVIAHFLLDACSFLGYVYLHDKVSWI